MVDTKGILSILKKKKLQVTSLADDASPCTVGEWVSTGCLALDAITGGGLPVGRLTEIYGDESTGKSLVVLQVAAVAQAAGHIAGMADSENAVAKTLADAVGVDKENLIYESPDTIEEVFEFFEATIDAKQQTYPDELLVLIWDSVAATSSLREMEKDYGSTGYLDHARIISQAMRKITRKIQSQRICMVFTNQVRENIGVMFGSSKTTFGGKAIGFHASLRIELSPVSKIKTAKKKVIGRESRALVTKNRMAPPFQEVILPVYFGSGIDDAGAALYWLKDHEMIIVPKAARELTLVLPGTEQMQLPKSEWPKFFNDNYDILAEIMSEACGTNLSTPDNASEVEEE